MNEISPNSPLWPHSVIEPKSEDARMRGDFALWPLNPGDTYFSLEFGSEITFEDCSCDCPAHSFVRITPGCTATFKQTKETLDLWTGEQVAGLRKAAAAVCDIGDGKTDNSAALQAALNGAIEVTRTVAK